MTSSITRLTWSAVAVLAPLAGATTPAYAGHAIGGCTNNYTAYSYVENADHSYSMVDFPYDDPAAADVAPVVDANHDNVICYKPYPNGQHNNGNGGNLVDDMAGPHT